ncbi:hypothetical protein JZ751_025707 [Albula glossodonta]|uniref:Mannose-1-phosphate guanyltransferase C-terminal domain-containing protein n=1 Tax=Albula glossodonta TaxID=121402 RepID=A0A8T2NDC5_9TELE|nr:hypothetical protein JZ751_025707 [Albula glossodonta]
MARTRLPVATHPSDVCPPHPPVPPKHRHPRMRIRTGLLDAHLYCLKKSVVDFLADNKSISSIRGELVPYLVRKQFSKFYSSQKNKEDLDQNLKKKETNTNAEIHIGSMDDEQLQLAPKLMEEPPVHPSAAISERSLVGADSIIGASCQISDKTSIKRSTIGSSSVIKEKVKIASSIIMSGVTIEEGCPEASYLCYVALYGLHTAQREPGVVGGGGRPGSDGEIHRRFVVRAIGTVRDGSESRSREAERRVLVYKAVGVGRGALGGGGEARGFAPTVRGLFSSSRAFWWQARPASPGGWVERERGGGVGCNIQGSVICSNAIIGRGADLKYCLVGSSQRIEPEGGVLRSRVQSAVFRVTGPPALTRLVRIAIGASHHINHKAQHYAIPPARPHTSRPHSLGPNPCQICAERSTVCWTTLADSAGPTDPPCKRTDRWPRAAAERTNEVIVGSDQLMEI